MLKLVILDLDGLMLDTERIYLSAFSTVCARFGLPDHRDIYLKTIGADDEQERILYGAAFPHIDSNLFLDEIQAVSAQMIEDGHLTVKPGLFKLLDAIDQMGGILKAVVTSSLEEVSLKLLAQNGILHRLDGGVYREMVSNGKPAPDSHLLCCRMFSVSPGDALVLEDSENGLRAAQAAGIPAIAVPDLLEPSADILSRCLARCGDLEEVIPWLEKINK